MNRVPKKYTIEMLDKDALIDIIKAMFKNEIPDLLIKASAYNTCNRKLRKLRSSLELLDKKIKKQSGNKRKDLVGKGVKQYRMYNNLFKKHEELLSVLKGTEFDPLRNKQSTGKDAIGKEA